MDFACERPHPANTSMFFPERWRSYSIASWPDNGNILELCIVLLEGGVGTSYLFNEVKEGSELILRGPVGVFTLDEDNFDKDSLIFIRKIYENCPSIEFLSLIFPPSEEHFTEFEKLLKVCQNLKTLLLIISNDYEISTNEKMSKNGKKLLKVLIRSEPINLREIRFFKNFKF